MSIPECCGLTLKRILDIVNDCLVKSITVTIFDLATNTMLFECEFKVASVGERATAFQAIATKIRSLQRQGMKAEHISTNVRVAA